MPELPEVEVTRRSFASEITGAQILAAVPGKPLRWPLGCSPARLVGQRVQGVRRRGKYLLVDLSAGLLLVHLGVLGAINSLQFTAMNTVTLIDLDDASASSGNSLLSVVAQLSLSLGVACAGALLGGFTAEVGNDGVDTILGAFQLTFVTVGIMAMLAATIFSQLSREDGRRVKRPESHIEP